MGDQVIPQSVVTQTVHVLVTSMLVPERIWFKVKSANAFVCLKFNYDETYSSDVCCVARSLCDDVFFLFVVRKEFWFKVKSTSAYVDFKFIYDETYNSDVCYVAKSWRFFLSSCGDKRASQNEMFMCI